MDSMNLCLYNINNLELKKELIKDSFKEFNSMKEKEIRQVLFYSFLYLIRTNREFNIKNLLPILKNINKYGYIYMQNCFNITCF